MKQKLKCYFLLTLGKANGEAIIHHMEKEEIIKIDTLKNLVMKNGDSGTGFSQVLINKKRKIRFRRLS